MYRPGMGVDPWYENFKFFLTYWLLSSNNRDRIGDGDQLPPPPPPPPPPNGPQGQSFMSPPPPHHKSNHGGQGQGQGNHDSKSPIPINSSGNTAHQVAQGWDSLDKNHGPGNSPRHSQSLSLSDNFGDLSLKQHLQQHQHLQNGPTSAGSHGSLGGHGNLHHLNHQTNPGMPPDHLVSDKDRRHVCPHCYKGFRSRQQLNQHNLVHSGVRKYHCQYCERAFKQLSHLQQHHRIHTGEKPYRCPLEGCDRAFAQMSNLQHHMRQHDKTTFGQKHCMCPFCDRGYASEKSLKSHLSKMHPDSKMLNIGNPRSSLASLIDGQGHPMLGGSHPSVPISHRHSLPSMHPGMKSPLTPPGGPLELTVNSVSHQRNSMGGGDNGRKYSLDSAAKMSTLNSDIPHDPKFFQRSLSERLPDRDQNKLDSMFDQRYGLPNHIRDVNRFSGRSFEPFSPSRFHETMRSFDFKEIDSKIFDASGEKFQRMAENFNEFRSRFQDQMFRRDGIRGNGMPPYDNRNMINEMNDRNSFFNSRSDIGLGGRDRYVNNSRGGFGSMNGNDIDSFGTSRGDDPRVHSRNNVGMASPNPSVGDYNTRRNEGPNDDLNIQMDTRRDMRGAPTGMRLDQTGVPMRMGSESDMMINRGRGLQMNPDTDIRMPNRNEIIGNRDNEMASMNQRNGMEMGMGPSRLMMQRPGDGADMMNGRNSLIRQGSDLMNGGGERMAGRRDMDMVDGGTINLDDEHEMHDRRVTPQHQPQDVDMEMEKSRRDMDMLNGGDMVRSQTRDAVDRHRDMDMLNGGDMVRSQTRDAVDRHRDMTLAQNRDMTLDVGMTMNDVGRNGPPRNDIGQNDPRLHSRNEVQMDMCNDMGMNGQDGQQYSDKPDMRLQNQNIMLNRSDGNLSVHDDLTLSRPSSIHQLSQQNGQKPGCPEDIMENDDLDFVDGNDNKKMSSPNQMTEAIRQRKRKPANPQHVFMPSIDHYTLGFQTDEVEDCGGLMLDVENGSNFERRLTTVESRN